MNARRTTPRRAALRCLLVIATALSVLTVTGNGPATVSASSTSVQSIPPARLLESRRGAPTDKFVTVDHQFEGVGRTGAKQIRELTVANRGGVPADAEAVFLYVVAILPSGPGFLTLFPCDETRPNAANVNYGGGDVAANAVLAKIGAGGKVCIYTEAATDLVIDVTGYTPPGADTTAVTPARFVESRRGADFITKDGRFQGFGRLRAKQTLEVDIGGRVDVPADADAAFMYIAAINPAGPGFLIAFPCGTAKPNAATVNYGAGGFAANAAMAKMSTDGKICIYTEATTDLVIDITGFTSAGAETTAISPSRFFESRRGAPDLVTIDGAYEGTGRAAAKSVVEVQVRNRPGVPANADSVFLYLVAINPGGPGFLTAFPCGGSMPLAASVNYGPGAVAANAVLARVGSLGKVCVYTEAATDLVIDVTGFTQLDAGATTVPPPFDDDFAYLYATADPQAPYTLDGQGYLGWDPCSPITFRTNLLRAQPGDRALLLDVLDEITMASGFTFTDLGDVTGDLDTGTDGVINTGGAEAVFGFSDDGATPILSGSTVGIGGAGGANNVQQINGKPYLVRGGYAIADIADLDHPDANIRNGQLRSTLLHEIAHMLGLNHVFDDATEIMFPRLTTRTTYNNGDRNGLYNLGTPQCVATRSAPLSRTADDAPAPAAINVWVADHADHL